MSNCQNPGDALEHAEAAILALARAVDSRDPVVKNHVDRVAQYAVCLGELLDLSPEELMTLRRAGLVHDIGKIGIPDAILFKYGRFTRQEWEFVQQHPETGYKLLQPVPAFAAALPAVRFHHERLDGSGYPLGLSGDEVPLLAQIVAIADIFDAVTARRLYRDSMKTHEAFNILRDETKRGLHDEDLVELFIGWAGDHFEPSTATTSEEPYLVTLT